MIARAFVEQDENLVTRLKRSVSVRNDVGTKPRHRHDQGTLGPRDVFDARATELAASLDRISVELTAIGTPSTMGLLGGDSKKLAKKVLVLRIHTEQVRRDIREHGDDGERQQRLKASGELKG